ncbi:MAG: TolC family protein [Candidatus Omnitrophica bacterium]|nr:TolC family protein [Candidatus Omnitrophota bacterium]
MSFTLDVSAGEITLALDEAIAIALRDNRDMRLKESDVQKAKAKIFESRTGFLPTVSATAVWSKTSDYYPDKDISQVSAQATVKQTIYKSGKIINTLQQSRYGFEVSRAILDGARLDTVFSVTKAFYTYCLAREYAALNKKILENTEEHLAMVVARYRDGQASESDVLAIRESRASVMEAVAASASQVEAARALLCNLLALDKDIAITPRGDFDAGPKEVAYEEAFLEAMSRRPEIRQYVAQEKSSQKAVEIARADGRPTIYASWDYYNKSHVVGASGITRNWNEHNVLGVTVSWPIFDGWATKAKVEQALIDVKAAGIAKEKTVADIALELKNAYLDFKDAIAKINSVRAHVATYKDTEQVVREKYKEGSASSLEVSDASLGYDIAVFNQRQAFYDYTVAKALFDTVTGGYA